MWRRAGNWLYDRLALNQAPAAADLIFVLAGRMERKRYGLELYRAGFAPRLLVSVGRFEVSRMRLVDFPGADELTALRDRTPPDQRHFFCELDASGLRIERPELRRWSTYGEVLALREFLKPEMPRRVMVVSTDVHLRRIALVFDKVFRDVGVEARYCPVPAGYSPVGKERWWSRRKDRSYVLKETIKLAAYRAILRMPEAIARRLMRLKHQAGAPARRGA